MSVIPRIPVVGPYTRPITSRSLGGQVTPQGTRPTVFQRHSAEMKLDADRVAVNFFGEQRARFMSRQLETIAAGEAVHQVVVGTRRAGKTVFIEQSCAIANRDHPNVHPVSLNVMGISTKIGLYKKMYSMTFGESPSQEVVQDADLLADHFFERLEEKSKTDEIVIYIDEASSLYKADSSFFMRLRRLKDRVSVVFVSFVEDLSFHSQEARQQMREASASFSPSLNHFTFRDLPRFEAADVAQLVSYRFFGDPDYAGFISHGYVEFLLLMSAGNICHLNSLIDSLQEGPIAKLELTDEEVIQDWVCNPDKQYEDFMQFHIDHENLFLRNSVIAQHDDLVLEPIRSSHAFGINVYGVFRAIVRACLREGQISVRHSEVFSSQVMSELNITDDVRPIFIRMLKYFIAQGFIDSKSADDGDEIYTVVNFPAFLRVALEDGRHGYTLEDLSHIFSGEHVTSESVAKRVSADRGYDQEVMGLSEGELARVGETFQDAIYDYDDLDLFGYAFYYLSAIRQEMSHLREHRVSLPSKLDPEDHAEVMALITALTGGDLAKLKRLLQCLATVPRKHFEMEFFDGKQSGFIVTSAAIAQAMVRMVP